MKNKLNTKGYNLYMIETDTWIFDDNSGQLFDGSFASVIFYAVNKGFNIENLEFAVEEMLAKGHDAAHFGIYRSMIFTFNRKEKKVA